MPAPRKAEAKPPRKPSGASDASLNRKADAVISRLNKPKPVR